MPHPRLYHVVEVLNDINDGGYTVSSGYTDTIEILKNDEQPLKWTESPAKLPFKCNIHKIVVYQIDENELITQK